MATRKTKPTSETTTAAKASTRRKRTTKVPVPNGGAVNYPTPDQIRIRAYELYLGRGGSHGSDLDDWFAAERELSATVVRTT